MALGADSMSAASILHNDNTYYVNAGELSNAMEKFDNDLVNASTMNGRVIDSANTFITNSQTILVGESWDTIRNSLQTVVTDSEASMAIGNMINQTQEECLKIVTEFLAPDYDLNTDDLSKYELEKEKLEKEISALVLENTELGKVPKTIYNDGDGKDNNLFKYIHNPFKYIHNPKYDVAVAKIASNNLKIETELQPKLDEVIRLIEKINTFNNEILPDIELKLSELESKIAEFVQHVDDESNSINPLLRLGATALVGLGNIAGGVLKAGENFFDGIVWLTGGAICDIGTFFGADMEEEKKNLADAIAVDVVGGAMDAIYDGSAINNASYFAYDSKEMNIIYQTSNGVATTVVEGLLPTPLAVGIGAIHEAGSRAEELYASDPNAQAGIFTGDYAGRITASGISGGIKGYLSNNAFDEIRKYGTGINSYNYLGDYLRQRRGDIIGETAIDFTSNFLDDYADNGTAPNYAGAAKRSLAEQTVALAIGAFGGTRGFEITSIGLDMAQGIGLDDMIVEEAKLIDFPFKNR